MYLVELQQGDRCHTVSLFREKKKAKEWIEALSYVVGYPHKDFIPNRAIKIEIEKITQ